MAVGLTFIPSAVGLTLNSTGIVSRATWHPSPIWWVGPILVTGGIVMNRLLTRRSDSSRDPALAVLPDNFSSAATVFRHRLPTVRGQLTLTAGRLSFVTDPAVVFDVLVADVSVLNGASRDGLLRLGIQSREWSFSFAQGTMFGSAKNAVELRRTWAAVLSAASTASQ